MIHLLNANALQIPLADKSVNCVVTSPPYYGLRDYGTAKWEGGDPECDHLQTNDTRDPKYTKQTQNAGTSKIGYKNICAKCGAIRIDNQIGLEQTPDEYVTNLVTVFRELRRVLRDDGTAWLNLGDSYAGGGRCGNSEFITGAKKDMSIIKSKRDAKRWGGGNIPATDGLKPKDLIGIPWRVAFALQADGWYLRSDIIWAKPNPMPESVTDRPTKSHEYIFLLSKSAKYYYDAEAIKIPSKEPDDNRGDRGNRKRFPTEKISGIRGPGIYPMANRRTVWTVATKPYSGAHFAAYPPELIEPCILAGCPKGGMVLDPFAGTGTTLQVARQYNRNAIGLD